MAPMVIIIGTNDDGVHYWRYEVHRHWRQWIAISTIFVAIVMTLLPNCLNNYQSLATHQLMQNLSRSICSVSKSFAITDS